MKNLFWGAIMLAMTLFLPSGCGQGPMLNQRPDTDVTSSRDYNFSSFAGTVWKTKVKMALAEIKQGMPKCDLHVIAPSSFDPTHPKYMPIADMQVIAELPPGTRLRVTRLMKNHGNWGGVWVQAILDGGEYSKKTVAVANKLLAKNRFIWQGWSDSKEWGVDPDMLEKAE